MACTRPSAGGRSGRVEWNGDACAWSFAASRPLKERGRWIARACASMMLARYGAAYYGIPAVVRSSYFLVGRGPADPLEHRRLVEPPLLAGAALERGVAVPADDDHGQRGREQRAEQRRVGERAQAIAHAVAEREAAQ